MFRMPNLCKVYSAVCLCVLAFACGSAAREGATLRSPSLSLCNLVSSAVGLSAPCDQNDSSKLLRSVKKQTKKKNRRQNVALHVFAYLFDNILTFTAF